MSERRLVETENGFDYVERRKKNDWVTRAASILSVVAWALAAVVLLFLDRAQPQKPDFFTYMFGATLNTHWNTSMLRISFLLLVLSLIICALAMVFNVMRSRRKTDKYRKSIIILGILSLIGIVAFLIVFGKYLI